MSNIFPEIKQELFSLYQTSTPTRDARMFVTDQDVNTQLSCDLSFVSYQGLCISSVTGSRFLDRHPTLEFF